MTEQNRRSFFHRSVNKNLSQKKSVKFYGTLLENCFLYLFSLDILCKYTEFVCVELTRRLLNSFTSDVETFRSFQTVIAPILHMTGQTSANRVSLGMVFGPPKPFTSGPKSRSLSENGQVIILYSTCVLRHRDTWQSRLLRHPNDRCQSLKREELLDSSEQVSVRVRCC